MRGIFAHRFTLADAMVLVAATAPGLILLRIAAHQGLFELLSGPKAPSGRNLITQLGVSGGCILSTLTLAVLILSLYKPRPTLRNAVGRPGFVACVAVAAAAVFSVAYFLIGVLWPVDLNSDSEFAMYFFNMFAFLTHYSGPMIVGAWIASGARGPVAAGANLDRPAWLRAGHCWVCIFVSGELYFIMQPLLLRWRAL